MSLLDQAKSLAYTIAKVFHYLENVSTREAFHEYYVSTKNEAHSNQISHMWNPPTHAVPTFNTKKQLHR